MLVPKLIERHDLALSQFLGVRVRAERDLRLQSLRFLLDLGEAQHRGRADFLMTQPSGCVAVSDIGCRRHRAGLSDLEVQADAAGTGVLNASNAGRAYQGRWQ